MSAVDQEIETEKQVDDPNEKNGECMRQPLKRKRPEPIERHIATAADGTTLYCCPECHLAYPQQQRLKQHLEVHKMERRFICDICEVGFKRSDHLARHIRVHIAEKSFLCSICKKGFKRKEHLKLHEVIHSKERTEICGVCDKGFYRKDHLRKHMKTHLRKRVKDDPESDSDTTASSNDSFIHSKERTEICGVCDEGFNRKYNLQRHMRTHLRKPVKDEPEGDSETMASSNNSFKRKEALKLHQVIHSKEKTESCGVCGKVFSRKDNLQRHVKIHLRKPVKDENNG